MTAQPKPTQPIPKMTVDEFLVWADSQPGRHELLDGEVFAMSPERLRHAEVKASVYLALRASLGRATVTCRVLPDGMTVRIDPTTAFEPDALVYCGARIDPDAIEIPDPVIVVEVFLPSTRTFDSGYKLAGYFRIASVMHCLMVDPVRRLVIHHKRGGGDLIETRIAGEGILDLSPPGLSVPVSDLFAEA